MARIKHVKWERVCTCPILGSEAYTLRTVEELQAALADVLSQHNIERAALGAARREAERQIRNLQYMGDHRLEELNERYEAGYKAGLEAARSQDEQVA